MTMPKISNFRPYQFNKKCELGTIENEYLPNGNKIKQFVPNFTLHFMDWKRSIAQDNSIYGTEFADTKMIVIRHNPKVNTKIQCRIKDVVYDIEMDNVDDSNIYITYDILTLKQVNGGK